MILVFAHKQCQAYCTVAMETNLPDLLGPQCFEVCLGIEFWVQMNDDAISNEGEKKNLWPLKHLWQLAHPIMAAPFSAEVPPVTRTLLPHMQLKKNFAFDVCSGAGWEGKCVEPRRPSLFKQEERWVQFSVQEADI